MNVSGNETKMKDFGRESEAERRRNRYGCLNAKKRKAFSGRQILLVEDNSIDQKMTKDLLQSAGLSVVSVSDGTEAVSLLKSKTGSMIDLVLMDIQMPMMDGYEATMKLRHDLHLTDLPVIAMTGHTMKGDREKCLDAGMNDYLSKPVDEEHLMVALDRWLSPLDKVVVPEMETTPVNPMSIDRQPDVMPGVDRKAFHDRFEDRWPIYCDLMKHFHQNYGETSERIASLLGDGKWNQVAQFLHTLKGVAGTLALKRLQEAAVALEKVIQAEHFDDTEALVHEIEIALKESLETARILEEKASEGVENTNG